MNIKYDHLITFLWIKDWDKAVKFYIEVLGLHKTYDNDGWAEFSFPGLKDAYIAVNRWVKDEDHPKNSFVTMRVVDIEAFRAHLLANDVKVLGPIEDYMEEGQGMRMFKFNDPDGNILTAAEIIM